MRGFHNSSIDPQTLVVLEAAFDEAWLLLKSVGNRTHLNVLIQRFSVGTVPVVYLLDENQ